MIKSWRKGWGYEVPFYFVQLANFQKPNDNPGDDDWARLREAQTMALSLPKTGMALAIDIGEAGSIHPTNKQEVGRRQALNALKQVYGEKDLVFSVPMYAEMEKKDQAIVIKFKYVGSRLKVKGDKLLGFTIAGADGKFVWADAKIQGDTVLVSSAAVAKPVAVRYAWSINPAGANLYNNEGLPASPFRTDDWPKVPK